MSLDELASLDARSDLSMVRVLVQSIRVVWVLLVRIEKACVRVLLDPPILDSIISGEILPLQSFLLEASLF